MSDDGNPGPEILLFVPLLPAEKEPLPAAPPDPTVIVYVALEAARNVPVVNPPAPPPPACHLVIQLLAPPPPPPPPPTTKYDTFNVTALVLVK
jgi:hypothetical protein